MVNVITFLGPILVTLSAYFWMASNWKKGKLSSEIFIHRCRWLKGLLPFSSVILSPVIWYFKDSLNSLPDFIASLALGLWASLFITELMTSYYRRKVMGVALFKRTELKKEAGNFMRASPVLILFVCFYILVFNYERFKPHLMNHWVNFLGFWFLMGFGYTFGLIFIGQKIKFPMKEVSREREIQIRETLLNCGYSSVEIVCVDDEVLRYQFCHSFLGKKGLRFTISDTLLHTLTSEEIKALVMRGLAMSSKMNRFLIAISLSLVMIFVTVCLDRMGSYFQKSGRVSLLCPIVLFATLLGLKRFLTFICFNLDKKAVELGANPVALISALEKEADLNFVPKNKIIPAFSPGNGLPSLEERKKRLAA